MPGTWLFFNLPSETQSNLALTSVMLLHQRSLHADPNCIATGMSQTWMFHMSENLITLMTVSLLQSYCFSLAKQSL